jgi:hypothetical protein
MNFAADLAGPSAATGAPAAGEKRRSNFYLLESLRLQQGSQRSRLDEYAQRLLAQRRACSASIAARSTLAVRRGQPKLAGSHHVLNSFRRSP